MLSLAKAGISLVNILGRELAGSWRWLRWKLKIGRFFIRALCTSVVCPFFFGLLSDLQEMIFHVLSQGRPTQRPPSSHYPSPLFPLGHPPLGSSPLMSSRRSALGAVSNRANRENVHPPVGRRTSGGGSSSGNGKRRASSRSAPVSRRRYDDDEDEHPALSLATRVRA